jgi:UDP-3-O-[3-hydroxymyristoyl] glucosamine N-acyltransferase
MPNKKFELTNTILKYGESKLYQIRALQDFGNVKKGDLGGWVEKEENLSHDGNCWIYDNARVFNNGKVKDNARIFNNSEISHNASINNNVEIYGQTNIWDNTKIYDEIEIHGDNVIIEDNAEIHGQCLITRRVEIRANAKIMSNGGMIKGNALIVGDLFISGNAKIGGHTKIMGKTVITSNNDIFWIPNIGPKHITITAYRGSNNEILINNGMNLFTINQFEKIIKITHKNREKYIKEYETVIQLIKIKMEPKIKK